MHPVLQTVLGLGLIGVILLVVCRPLGTWLYRVFTDDQHWRVERVIYRTAGVDPDSEQRWTRYAVSVVAFGVASVAFLWLLILVQGWLPWSLGRSQNWHTALNTAISFTTNTNWQSYAGEAGAGHTVQMVGLTVQNFVSAATGIAVAIALEALAKNPLAEGDFYPGDLLAQVRKVDQSYWDDHPDQAAALAGILSTLA